ncbi:MAG: hypothetical protein HRT67_03670 [Flavobacteriaceae bacterium]|nr:hypothetical protein [Flavobacteriaceae bacterium]
MKISKIIILILFVFMNFAVSQNIITNGDFEDFINCPTGYSQIDTAIPGSYPTSFSILNNWTRMAGSSDYFNVCASATNVGIPANGFTQMLSPVNGNGYAGIITHSINGQDFREYLVAELNAPLVAEENYILKLSIAPGGL